MKKVKIGVIMLALSMPLSSLAAVDSGSEIESTCRLTRGSCVGANENSMDKINRQQPDAKLYAMNAVAKPLLMASAAPDPQPVADNVSSGKDLCLLLSQNCANRVDSITEIIAKLQKEIGKGQKVYTKDEVAALESKVAYYQGLYENLQRN